MTVDGTAKPPRVHRPPRVNVPRVKGGTTGVLLVAVVSGCSHAPSVAEKPAPGAPAQSVLPEPPAPVARPARAQLDGHAFPDKVLALTWDDGPDAESLTLARYLHAEGVSATFFVVGEWIDGLSEEPGQGRGVFETGHEHIPILGDLIALGHRVGNHTLNHVLLDGAPAGRVAEQLRENQDRIEPFLTGELRLFRVPGGAWSAAASAVVDADPALSRLVGPVRWDIDRKDWEGSLYCRSSHPSTECERAAPGGGLRVKAAVTAQRYLSSIEAAGHGIVLLHDRVGHVGSAYAREVAEVLIPALKARRYVFAAPVLRFSPLAPRAFAASDERSGETLDAARAALAEGMDGEAPQVGDVDGDGRADVCARTRDGIVCALSTGASFGKPRKWSSGADFGDADASAWGSDVGYHGTIRLGDVNGDGRADVCGRGHDGVVCALSDGRGFLKATTWLPEMSDAAGWLPARYGGTMRLVDVDGDGRADLCARGPEGEVCALAP